MTCGWTNLREQCKKLEKTITLQRKGDTRIDELISNAVSLKQRCWIVHVRKHLLYRSSTFNFENLICVYIYIYINECIDMYIIFGETRSNFPICSIRYNRIKDLDKADLSQKWPSLKSHTAWLFENLFKFWADRSSLREYLPTTLRRAKKGSSQSYTNFWSFWSATYQELTSSCASCAHVREISQVSLSLSVTMCCVPHWKLFPYESIPQVFNLTGTSCNFFQLGKVKYIESFTTSEEVNREHERRSEHYVRDKKII